MEQAQYWMWMKKRQFLKTNFQVWKNNSTNDSWEEKAFAEDASGSLGGCTWPPRSYSCSFCKREFRSAQALGGHMNVHRRDRARLKQSLSSPQNNDQNFHYQNNSNQNPLKSSFDFHLDYINLDPNASTLTSSRVSALSNQENLSDSTFVSPSSIIQEKPNKVSTSLTHDHQGFVDTDLFMGFNSVATQSQFITDSCGDISFKRPKTAISALSFLIKPCSNDRYSLQPEVIEAKSSSMEDIDLELRLGEPPKVK